MKCIKLLNEEKIICPKIELCFCAGKSAMKGRWVQGRNSLYPINDKGGVRKRKSVVSFKSYDQKFKKREYLGFLKIPSKWDPKHHEHRGHSLRYLQEKELNLKVQCHLDHQTKSLLARHALGAGHMIQENCQQ